jgi:DNA-binding response OmpR family regulator
LGTSDYLQKPCSLDELALRAERCLEKLTLKRELQEQTRQLKETMEALKISLDKTRAHEHLLEQRVQERTESLAQAKAEAEKSSQVKSDFLSHMSHEPEWSRVKSP